MLTTYILKYIYIILSFVYVLDWIVNDHEKNKGVIMQLKALLL